MKKKEAHKSIMKSSSRLILLIATISVCYIATIRAQTNVDDIDAPKSGPIERPAGPERLTIIAPKKIRPLSDYHVLVNLAESSAPASIDLSLTAARDSNQEQTEAKSILISSGETQTIKFNIGDWRPSEFVLNVTAQAVDRSWTFSREASLDYDGKTYSTLIQSDKAIYKPGQEVKFRVITLTPDLTPKTLKGELNVTILDPRQNVVKQWTGLSNYRGLLTLEFQLSEDPMFGLWLIQVSNGEKITGKHFQVAEYILPTFDVNIKLPTYATHGQSDILASVDATYTFGKPVNGHVALTVQPLIRYSYLNRPLQTKQYRAQLKNGKADFQIDLVKDLQLERDIFEREVEFFALVTEDHTGRKYNKTQKLSLFDKDVKVELINRNKAIKPGMEHEFKFKVAYQDDTPVEDNGPEMLVEIYTRQDTINSTSAKVVAGLAEVRFHVPKDLDFPLYSYINPRVHYRGKKYTLAGVELFESQSKQFMQISFPRLTRRSVSDPAKRVANVNDDLRVRVVATEAMNQVTCQAIARGDIVWALSRDAKNQSEFEFDAKISPKMTPEAQILCFYIRKDNKEMIADSEFLHIAGMIKNSVKLNTDHNEAKPGQEVEVNVLTKPNSLVGVLGIDQSVLLLKSGNDITLDDVTKETKSYGSSRFASRSSAPTDAESLFETTDFVVLTNTLIAKKRHPIFFMSASAAYSDKIVLATSSSSDNEVNPPEFQLKRVKSQPVVIRSQFPETWLWDNATVGQDGIAHFKAKVPDTITSWILSAFSLNEEFGFGLSTGKTSVRVFRPFFIKLNLPYSIIRGEIVNIQAVVFNYGKRPVSAIVTMENKNDEYDFVEAANDIDDENLSSAKSQSRMINIDPQDGSPVSFLVKPKKLGQIEIRMIARTDLASDGISKRLLVKAEGQTQYINKALVLDLPGTQSTVSHNFSIDVPENAVPGSQKVSVSAVGDIMGPGLSNVDDLLRIPYGCGEQNMINLVPNIVIMKYLESSRRLKDIQRTRALRNIEAGYQRELNYRRNDGSFSAFGNQDANGSVWLTSYVLKTFQQARSLISVDENVINLAANFIAKHSRPDGSIQDHGMIHQKSLQSESALGSPIYLTAYSMIALLQRPIQLDHETVAPVAIDEVLEKGLSFIEQQLNRPVDQIGTYDLAISAYTLQLANRQRSMQQAYDLLWSRAQNDSELTWWSEKTNSGERESEGENAKLIESPDDASSTTSTIQPPLKPIKVNAQQSAHFLLPDSLSVEITALALLTTVGAGQMERALPIVKWLIQHQNSNGGFSSTQDTVLAIEALSRFASQVSTSAPSIDIELIYPRQVQSRSAIRRNSVDEILITSSNALVMQQTQLPDNITWVLLKANGIGAAVVQASWQYNLLVSAEKPAFFLNLIVDKASSIDYLQLSVCTFYKAGDSSNMAVVEVELPSGYVADQEALPSLKRTREIKRIDTADGETKVFIYLDRVTRDEICFTVPAHRSTKVSHNKPVPVSIYDYYNRHHAARIFYEPQPSSSCDICEPDSCSNICQRKPKRSDKLISLHEQRQLSSRLASQKSQADSTSPARNPSGTSNEQKPSNLLPLASVLTTVLTMASSIS